jgi:hypothetical protein
MMFLAQHRRIALIEALMAQSMPADLATRVASYSDNLYRLDYILCRIAGRLSERCQRIEQAFLSGNEEQQKRADVFLSCDLLIFNTYRAEASDRQLHAGMFPRTMQVIASSLRQIEDNKAAVTLH